MSCVSIQHAKTEPAPTLWEGDRRTRNVEKRSTNNGKSSMRSFRTSELKETSRSARNQANRRPCALQYQPSFHRGKTGTRVVPVHRAALESVTPYAACLESSLSIFVLGGGTSRHCFSPDGRGTEQQPFARSWPSARSCAPARYFKRSAGATGSASSRRKSKPDWNEFLGTCPWSWG